MTERRWTQVLVGLTAAFMTTRLLRWPLESYGDSAAQYIEHLARLRLIERVREGLPGSPLEALKALDGLYPPGLHLVEAAWGALVGHSAEAVLWLGFGWWLLLCGSVAKLARNLWPDRPQVGPLAFSATALVPALQATALRSYYDLPMTSLLWLALAVLTSAARFRGVWAGLALVGAALIKWTALPFGVVMVGALVLVQGRPLLRPALSALSMLGLWSVVFIGAGAESFSTMGGATFQPAPGVSVSGAEGPLRWIAVAIANAAQWDLQRLLFYPERLITTVLSPVGALVLGGAVVRGGSTNRRALTLAGLIGAGQVAFLLLLVPIQDDRFLLTVAPGLALVAATGLAGRMRAAAAAAMVLVSADAHLWSPVVLGGEGDARPAAMDGRAWTPRLGMSSSVDRRGWSRSADMLDNKTEAREQLWQAVVGCGGGVVDASERLLSPTGDLNWWTYRRTLASVSGDAITAMWRGEPGAAERPPSVWVGREGAGPGSDRAAPRDWPVQSHGPWQVASPRSCTPD